MITTLDAIDLVWQRIDASNLKPAVSGGVYKHSRPTNSTSEDVVINALPITNQQLQMGIINVNIHVPDLDINTNEVQDKSADHARMKTLADLAVEALTDYWAGDYHFDIQQQTTFNDDDAGSHYINIRLEFFNVNLSN